MKNFINKKVSLFIAFFVIVQGVSLSAAEKKAAYNKPMTLDRLLGPGFPTLVTPDGGLFNSIEADDIKLVERSLLRYGADVNARNSFKMTPLMIAAAGGNKSIVKELLDHGARIDDYFVGRDKIKKTAIDCALEAKQLKIALYLLEQGAKITGSVQDAILISAAGEGHADIVRQLLTLKANPFAQNKRALQSAQANGHAAVEELLKAEITRQEKDQEKLVASFQEESPVLKAAATSLKSAAKNKNKKKKDKEKAKKAISVLQSKIAVPAQSTADHLKALEAIKAETQQKEAAYKAGLEAFRINLEKEQAERALEQIKEAEERRLMAAENKIGLAKKREQSLDLETNEKQLIDAAITGDMALAERMLAKKVNPNCTNNAGLSALAVAIQFHRFDIAATLQKHGAKSVDIIVDAHRHPMLLQLEHKS